MVCVTGGGAGEDNVWEQEELEAWKMLKNGDESPPSSARFVSPLFILNVPSHPHDGRKWPIPTPLSVTLLW